VAFRFRVRRAPEREAGSASSHSRGLKSAAACRAAAKAHEQRGGVGGSGGGGKAAARSPRKRESALERRARQRGAGRTRLARPDTRLSLGWEKSILSLCHAGGADRARAARQAGQAPESGEARRRL
jgi:hypothetical protein